MRAILFCFYVLSLAGVGIASSLLEVPPLPLVPPAPEPSPGLVPAPEQAAQVKYVVAHFMVGNTYPYKVGDWLKNIQIAMKNGIDGFALNIGREDWMQARVADAFAAARGTPFKLFISFDMTSIPCSSPADAEFIQKYIMTYFSHPNQFLYNGKPLVSTFSGEFCRFGTDSVNRGWSSAVKSLRFPVHFIPSFFIDPAMFSQMTAMDGSFCWNCGWPMGNNDINFGMDKGYINNLGKRTYMASVSPWFFTHYGPDTWNKNWIFRSDDWLLAERWEQLIQNRRQVDLVEVITWNDYGESHYVGPIMGDQPNSHAWVDGFDHQGWLGLINYFIVAFKTGSYPAVTKDQIYLWSRLYPRGADASDRTPRPNNWEWTEDTLWAVVLLAEPADVLLSCGPTNQFSHLGVGMSKLKMELKETCSVSAAIIRAGLRVMEFEPLNFRFSTGPPSYNFNAFVAASS